MNASSSLLAASLALCAPGLALAGPSLNDARAGINAGTWPGITVLDFKAKPQAAVAAAPAASAPGAAGGTAATAPQAARPAAPQAAPQTAPRAAAVPPSSGAGTGIAIGWGGPLTHQSMHDATRLEGPSIGITLPSASSAASAPSARP